MTNLTWHKSDTYIWPLTCAIFVTHYLSCVRLYTSTSLLQCSRFVTHYNYLTFVMCEIRHTLFTTHYICVWPLSCRIPITGSTTGLFRREILAQMVMNDDSDIWQRQDMTKARYMYCMIWPLSCHTYSKGRIKSLAFVMSHITKVR